MQIKEFLDWEYEDALKWFLGETPNQIAIGSHKVPVITLGRHASLNQIKSLDWPRYQLDRGGGACLHGPGQGVLYPLIDLNALGITIPQITWILEESMIQTLGHYGIVGQRNPLNPGVYTKHNHKIGFVGFKVTKGILSHGAALNICNDWVEAFNHIQTCGFEGLLVSSMKQEGFKKSELSAVLQLWGSFFLKHLNNNPL